MSVRDESHYDVLFEPGLLARYGTVLRGVVGDARPFVLTDRRVHRLYGRRLFDALRSAGYAPELLVVPDGERSKSMASFAKLLDRLAELQCDRRTVLICFGGGVISDTGGFVASAYMRGIPYVNFSTSLLGQIDACVGGKVAVNSRFAKNMIGAFYHPKLVAGDPELLSTLAWRDFKSGLAEGIKVAIIGVPELFEFIEREQAAIRARDPVVMNHVIGVATEKKMDWINLDPYEVDLRRPLNFGHTLGHPIETEFGYKGIRHGEAVAIGMGVATCMALQKGMIDQAAAERIWDILQAYDLLGFSEPIRPDSVLEHVRYVKLIRGRELHFVLPLKVGEVVITPDVCDADIVHGFEHYDRVVHARLGGPKSVSVDAPMKAAADRSDGSGGNGSNGNGHAAGEPEVVLEPQPRARRTTDPTPRAARGEPKDSRAPEAGRQA